jgi:hypothetical protein
MDREAVLHAGLMRHYGPLASPDEPYAALDSEVRTGFSNQAEQVGFEDELRRQVSLRPPSRCRASST